MELPFMLKDFNLDEFTKSSLGTELPVSDQLARLQAGMAALDRQLKVQIASHHEQLLSQATSIESVEGVLDGVRHHVFSLQSTTDRICGKVGELFNKTEMRTVQLERLHSACNLLRSIIRLMQLSAKLQQLCQGGTEHRAVIAQNDLSRSSQLLQEMREICHETDFTNVLAIEKDVGMLPKLHKDVLAIARDLLVEGLRAQNHVSVGTALQVFYNLKCMTSEVERIFKRWQDEIGNQVEELWTSSPENSSKKLSAASKAPGSANMPATLPQNPIALKQNLWLNVDKLVQLLVSVYSQTAVLQIVMERKFDTQTHQVFLDEFGGFAKICLFWTEIANEITKRMDSCDRFIRSHLENEYPKFLRQINEFLKLFRKVMREDFKLRVDLENVVVILRKCFVKLETAYLSKSHSRLFDSINIVFSDNIDRPPNAEEIIEIVKSVYTELSIAQFDKDLFGRVCRNVLKAVNLFAVKCEHLLSTDGEASQVISHATVGQLRNVAVVNSLFCFRTEVLGNLSKFETEYSEVMTDDLLKATDSLLQVMSNAITPLLQSILEAILAIIESMHKEDFAFGAAADSQNQRQCSLYMRELQQFISRVWDDHFARFACKEFVYEHTTVLARKACNSFLNHAVMLKPLADGGRLRLAADFAQVELALSPLCKRISDMGAGYQTLRALRPLLFETADTISSSPAIGSSVSFSLAMHLLISISDDELLQLPHASAGWSLSRYSDWLEKHPDEHDRLMFMKGTLEVYVRNVQNSGMKEYTPIYPLLLDLLKRGLSFVTLDK